MEIGKLAYKTQNRPALKQKFLYRRNFLNFLTVQNNLWQRS